MGSWDETCAISQFPISYGDRVKLILLEETGSETGKTQTYHNDLYSPFSFPLSGVYDDYGGIAAFKPDDVRCQVILDALSERHVPVPAGDNQYHERAVPDMKNWNTLLDGLQDGRVLLRHKYANYRKEVDGRPVTAHVIRVYVREDVWNEIVSREYEGWRSTLSCEVVFGQALNYFKNVVDLYHNPDKAFRFLGDHSFREYFMGSTSGSFGITECRNAIEKRLTNGTLTLEDPAFLDMAQSLSELVVAFCFLSDMRFAWHITAGTGSQENDYLSRADWHARLARIAIEIEKKHRDEWDVDEDEDGKDPYKSARDLLTEALSKIPPAPKPKSKRGPRSKRK